MIYFVSLALGVISTIVFLVTRVKEGGVKALLYKALSSTFFVGCGVAATFSSAEKGGSTVFPLAVVMGLVLGLMGDIWLDLKYVHPQDGDKFTFAGFGAFMIGHICFIGGLIKNYCTDAKMIYIFLPLVIAAVIAIAIIALEKPMKMVYGKFKTITAVYAFILVYMTLLSGSLALMNSFKVITLDFMFVGGVFFLISDLILSGTYFGEGKNRPVDIVTNHATYYIAQFVIASAILFA